MSRQAYATFAAAGIRHAALAVGGLGTSGGLAGPVPANGAGRTKFGELAGGRVPDADARREAAPLLRAAVPVGGAAGLARAPAEGFRADRPDRAVLVALARRPALPLVAGARTEFSAGAGTDHSLRALGMLQAARPGEASAGSADSTMRTIGVTRAGGDAGERQRVAGLRVRAARLAGHASARLADLVDPLHAIGVPLAGPEGVRHAGHEVVAADPGAADGEQALAVAAIRVRAAFVDAMPGGFGLVVPAAKPGLALVVFATGPIPAVAILPAGLAAKSLLQTTGARLGALSVARAGLAKPRSGPAGAGLRLAVLADRAVVVAVTARLPLHAPSRVRVAEGPRGAGVVSRADAGPSRGVADQPGAALGVEGARPPRFEADGLGTIVAGWPVAGAKEQGREEEPNHADRVTTGT